MEAIKRLELEMQSHRASITDTQRAMDHEKSELKRTLKKIESDVNFDNELENYDAVREYGDRICRHIKAIKELQQLIQLKLEIHLNHTKT